MLWINFLHLYQPANSDAHKIQEATDKSYSRIIKALEENTNIRITLNISGCLFLRWEELGYIGLIERIGKLIKEGRLELVGTAAYHALLPLVPQDEARRQIIENEEILKKYFGDNFKPKGFFFPEMAYGGKVAKIVKELGYEWIILDEISYNGNVYSKNCYTGESKDCDNKLHEGYFIDKTSGLKVIFRNRDFSQTFVPDTLTKLINVIPDKRSEDPGSREEKNEHEIPQQVRDDSERERDDSERVGDDIERVEDDRKIEQDDDKIYISATDGELYGLRHVDPTGVFEKLLKNDNLKTQTITEFISSKNEIKKIELFRSSWESTEQELKEKNPYALWNTKKNKIQQKIWELANLAYALMKQYKDDVNSTWVRWHFVRGLASCTFWWASARDFKLFSGISWSPDEIERGTNEFIRSIRAIESKDSREKKIEAEKLYIDIKQMVWNKHWKYYWKSGE